jgi:sugar fermentation stimulation protein A
MKIEHEESQKNRHDIMWPQLISGTLIKRYKRFLADVRLKNGHTVITHCPNTGSMLECSEPGRDVYLSRHNNANRKLKYTWEMIKMPASLVGVNTIIPNKLIKNAILKGKITHLNNYKEIRTEVKYGENSRIDILLENEKKKCFIEVKNCTLVKDKVAYFPDAISSRGLKHLIELQKQVEYGDRSIMLFLIQRMDAELFRPADHIDKSYSRELRKAVRNGVEILVYDVIIDCRGVTLNRSLPFDI